MNTRLFFNSIISNSILLVLLLAGLTNKSYSQTYPNNEDGQYEDMLTPEYYNTPNGGAFREEVNKFIHFARLIPFQNPFEDSIGNIPAYTVPRAFGDGLGPGGTGSHHPAYDFHVGNGDTLVNMYAVYDGIVSISRDVERYRHYLSITTDIKDSLNNIIGKMVTFYAHIDLDLDSMDNINLDGQYVNKGDLVSKHLYSGTMGGPHLHFEIRYYRPTDTGLEDFYGGNTGDNTSPSSGSWTYGYWNPNYGYGFANPENHLNYTTTGIISNDLENRIKYYPNPFNDAITIETDYYNNENITITNITGQIIYQNNIESNICRLNTSEWGKGMYFIKIGGTTKKIVKD